MGQDVELRKFTRRDRALFRAKVHDCLDALASMLAHGHFEVDEPKLGMEIELNLVDHTMQPAMANAEVLEAIADPDFQTELGQFNIEINLAPRPLRGDHMQLLEDDLRKSLNSADERARSVGSHLAMIGMLPTLQEHHFEHKWISANPRYDLLNQQIFAARGEDIELHIPACDCPATTRPRTCRRSATRSCRRRRARRCSCTCRSRRRRSPPTGTPRRRSPGSRWRWRANSPFFAGRALWHETRIPMFEQATDTRPPELQNQGVRPRVWFGERWITSIFDLFEENSRYFPALLPVCTDEDPLAMLARGEAPGLGELKLHNGTVYRWNRPVYDCSDGRYHLRLENRVLPAGPSVVDILADAAFYYGTLRAFVDAERPVWTQMSFDAAEENLHAAARGGLDSRLYWPEVGWVSPQELVLRRLLPMAHAGLESYGVDTTTRERYLGVIEGRALNRQTGSCWQRRAVVTRERAGESREQALNGMLADYLTLMNEGEPVHTWGW